MANYIDKDKLFIYLASMRFESNLDKGEVLAAISKLPTANVAPRAEVARDILGRLTNLIKTTESQEFFKGGLSWVVESDNLLGFIEELKKEFTEV